jgi:AcrR family transcriptional regulator
MRSLISKGTAWPHTPSSALDGESVETSPPPSSTRERILDAAEPLFADHGFSGTAMRDIGRSVGLNPGSLYNHFPSKQVLYEAVLERGIRPMFDLLDQLGQSEWTEEQLGASMDALMTHLARRPHIPRLLLHEELAGGEGLTRIARDWLQPLYTRALATFEGSGSGVLRPEWNRDELPRLVSALHYLVLGHFALAPVLDREVLQLPSPADASTPQAMFLRKLIRLLLFNAPSGHPPTPPNGPARERDAKYPREEVKT